MSMVILCVEIICNYLSLYWWYPATLCCGLVWLNGKCLFSQTLPFPSPPSSPSPSPLPHSIPPLPPDSLSPPSPSAPPTMVGVAFGTCNNSPNLMAGGALGTSKFGWKPPNTSHNNSAHACSVSNSVPSSLHNISLRKQWPCSLFCDIPLCITMLHHYWYLNAIIKHIKWRAVNKDCPQRTRTKIDPKSTRTPWTRTRIKYKDQPLSDKKKTNKKTKTISIPIKNYNAIKTS